MYTGRLISSDDHVFEPIDLWTTRTDKAYLDRAPHIVREPEEDWWVCGEQKLMSLGPGTQTGLRFEDPEKIRFTGQLENIRKGGYIPDERIKDMDQDGIEAGISYPSVGLSLYNLQDSDLLTVLLRAYNGWVAEFAAAYPKRLKAVGLLNVDDIPSAVEELTRIHKPRPRRRHDHHLSHGRPQLPPPRLRALVGGGGRPGHAARLAFRDQPPRARPAIRQTLAAPPFVRGQYRPLGPGVIGRHDLQRRVRAASKLLVGSIEQEVSWAPHFLERIDYTYLYRPKKPGRYVFKDAMKPSDFFHRNCFISFQQDSIGVRNRQYIGVDNLLWGSDYPHIESTFPRSREIIGETLEGCTEDEKAKIVCDNAARIYHLN